LDIKQPLKYWVDQFLDFRRNTVYKVDSIQAQLKALEAKHAGLVWEVGTLSKSKPAECDKSKDTKIAEQAAKIAQLEKALSVARDQRNVMSHEARLQRERRVELEKSLEDVRRHRDELAKEARFQQERAEKHKARYYYDSRYPIWGKL